MSAGVMSVQAGFDSVAQHYDNHFSNSAIGKLQRQRVYHFLLKSLGKKPLNILEINCGTGEDAVWLARQQHNVTATDSSQEMIAACREKIAQHHLQTSVVTDVLSFSELKSNLLPESFDCVFSNFGGLNCISGEELKRLANDVLYLLKPRGKFIAVIMGRRCLWEQLYFSVKGKKQEASRRSSPKEVIAGIGTTEVPVWYYSRGEIREIVSDHFEIASVKPVGLFIPPSYLNPFFENRRGLLSLLNFIEKLLPFSFFSNYADHFYIELNKK